MSRLAARRPRLSDERGFTIVELLLTCILGMIILGAATLITIGAARHNNEVAERTSATQTGRLALERSHQLLRSQVCTAAYVLPVQSAGATSVTFTADLSDGSRPVERHTLYYDSAQKKLLDSVVLGSGNPVTFAGTATTRELAANVALPASGKLFRYWAYPTPAPATGILEPSVELVPPAGTSLSATNIGRLAKVDVNFLTTGATRTTADIRAEMTDSVFVRAADPNDASGAFDPTCA